LTDLTHTRTLDKKAVFRLLSDDGTLATVAHIIALSAYGPEIYELDPLEILLRLEEDFNVHVTDPVENKLKAILLATATDLFYENPEAFRSISETLTNGDPGIDLLDTLTLPEAGWAMFEVNLNHGPRDLEPGVQRLLEHVINSEASEMGEGPEAASFDYVMELMREQHSLLVGQLSELGISSADVPALDDVQV
jgi:hypothetical protein